MNRMMPAVNIVTMRLHRLHEFTLQAAAPLRMFASCAGTVQHTQMQLGVAKNTMASASSASSPNRPPTHLHRSILSSATAHSLHPATAYASHMVHDDADS